MQNSTIATGPSSFNRLSGFLTTRSVATRFWIGLSVALLVIATAGAGVLALVRNEVRGQVSSGLQALLDSEIAGVRHWLNLRFTSLEMVVREPEVRDRAVAMLTSVTPVSDDDIAHLRATLNRMMGSLGIDEWRLADPLGVIRASSDSTTGKRVATELLDALSRACETNTTVFVPPVLLDQERIPRMALLVPLAGNHGAASGVLVARIDPCREFSSLLQGGRLGRTGETYAFDMQARLVSETRYMDALKERQLLPENATSSVFAVHLRRTEGAATGTDPKTLPMTAMAAEAVQGRDGITLDGYTDFRGVESVAAWRVLPDLGFAVVTKQDLGEAYRSVRVLWTAFLAVLVALALTSVATAVLARRGQSTMRRLAKVQAQVQTLGQYRLEQKLGQGGMGVVYRASHAMLRRPTAIKLMLSGSEMADAARFEREVQLTCSLTHPNTVAVYDFGSTADGQIYYAMEYLEGLSLAELIEQYGPMPSRRAVYLLSQACGALSEAHAKALIHRDIKPANIFVCVRGGLHDFVKVLDFGLAKRFDTRSASITVDNALSGTPMYMCPEIISDGADVDARSDIYALGCTAYELLTGRTPFIATSLPKLLHSHLHDTPDPPSRFAAVPNDLEILILSCLAKKPADRPPDAAELRRRLLACACANDWNDSLAEEWWRSRGPTSKYQNAETVIGFVAPNQNDAWPQDED